MIDTVKYTNVVKILYTIYILYKLYAIEIEIGISLK